MIRILVGASPVSRNGRFIGGVCACAPGRLVNISKSTSSRVELQRRTSAAFPSECVPEFLSISRTIRFTSWEDFGSGSRSFGRCPGSHSTIRAGDTTNGQPSDATSNLQLQLPCTDILTSVEVVERVGFLAVVTFRRKLYD